MSYEERRVYRRRKRLIRRIQVYAEIAFISIAIFVVGSFIVSHIKGNNKTMTVAAEEKAAAKEKKEETGLKVSSGDVDPDAAKEDASAEEAEEVSSSVGAYSAKETGDTVQIGGDVVSEYAILINNSTKEIVGERNANERIVPASMTKVMTVLVASKHISPDKLDDKVTMSHEAVDYSYAGEGSTSGFVEEEEMTVRDLFYGTILPSGGDAAAQLAMYVAGDIDSFVDMMNDLRIVILLIQ